MSFVHSEFHLCNCYSRFRCQSFDKYYNKNKPIHSFWQVISHIQNTYLLLLVFNKGLDLPQPMQVLISGHEHLWLRHFSTGYVSKINSIFPDWLYDNPPPLFFKICPLAVGEHQIPKRRLSTEPCFEPPGLHLRCSKATRVTPALLKTYLGVALAHSWQVQATFGY